MRQHVDELAADRVSVEMSLMEGTCVRCGPTAGTAATTAPARTPTSASQAPRLSIRRHRRDVKARGRRAAPTAAARTAGTCRQGPVAGAIAGPFRRARQASDGRPLARGYTRGQWHDCGWTAPARSRSRRRPGVHDSGPVDRLPVGRQGRTSSSPTSSCLLAVCSVWVATSVAASAQSASRLIVDAWRVEDGLPAEHGHQHRPGRPRLPLGRHAQGARPIRRGRVHVDEQGRRRRHRQPAPDGRPARGRRGAVGRHVRLGCAARERRTRHQVRASRRRAGPGRLGPVRATARVACGWRRRVERGTSTEVAGRRLPCHQTWPATK